MHRDLKPGNILLQKVDSRQQTVDSNGVADLGGASKKSTFPTDYCLLSTLYSLKITDFGIAKLSIGGENQTPTGAMLGTPGYMAPEQVGVTAPVGPAADIHALGAILYELLTGRPPFQAAEMLETLEQICFSEPVAPRRLVPTIPLDLETICLKYLQKSRAGGTTRAPWPCSKTSADVWPANRSGLARFQSWRGVRGGCGVAPRRPPCSP